MKVILKTRCGCTREVDIHWRANISEDTIRIPIDTPIGIVDSAPTYVKFYYREFKYSGGRNSQGLPIYVEVWTGY